MENHRPPPRRRRRWLQISLRASLVVMLLAAMFAAWWHYSRTERPQDVVLSVAATGDVSIKGEKIPAAAMIKVLKREKKRIAGYRNIDEDAVRLFIVADRNATPGQLMALCQNADSAGYSMVILRSAKPVIQKTNYANPLKANGNAQGPDATRR